MMTLQQAINASVIAVCVAAAMTFTPSDSQASADCLTKHEARKLWPRAHLYWYSADHCWSNRRGKPSGIRIDYVPPDKKAGNTTPWVEANADVTPAPKQDKLKVVKTYRTTEKNFLDEQADKPRHPAVVAYPSLVPGSGTAVDMLRIDPLTAWPLVWDLDDQEKFASPIGQLMRRSEK